MKFPGISLFAVVLLAGGSIAQAQGTVARQWNEEILAAIRIDKPNPPVHARNLFHLATVMYDAWAAYDTTAVGYIYHERVSASDIAAARDESISYAAYRLLSSRYADSANAATTMAALDAKMGALGYSIGDETLTGTSPAAVGNRIAYAVMTWGLLDGSNQSGGYADPGYTNPQPPMVVLSGPSPVGGIPEGTNPNLWQPLFLEESVSQNGIPNPNSFQKFVGATWLSTQAFSLRRPSPSVPWIDPGPPSLLVGAGTGYRQGVLDVLRASAKLNSTTPLDISPGAFGNNPLGTDGGTGQDLNPLTGQPYAANVVMTGDFARVMAEFWADGPHSETPPGHWHVLANAVTDTPGFQRRMCGTGPVLPALEWDVKLYFALGASTHDAACAAWSLKRFYQGPRPITMIRYMASKGQSTDPGLPSYDPDGLPLESGVCELITEESSAPGERHADLVDYVGEVAVYSWPGEPWDRATETSPVRWIRALDWLPYQRKNFNTPAFPGYVSGHSTFSRAAAEVLTAITGNEFFPGGLASFTAPADSYLVFERGPTLQVTLQWATYFDAADQAGQSRPWGGIHVAEDDYVGRRIGAQVGKQAWARVQKYWDASIRLELPTPALEMQSNGSVAIRFNGQSGMNYTCQSSTNLINWTPMLPRTCLIDGPITEIDPIGTAEDDTKFYRIGVTAP